MSNDKSPAFQHYPKDILTSARVAMMTLEEEGAYRRALDFCWLNGSLPSDPQKLALVIGKNCPIEVANTVQQMFIIDKKNPDKILHERLEVERKKQQKFREKKSKAGTASGLSRRKKNKLSAEQVFDSVDDVLRTKGEQKRTLHLHLQSSSSSPENTSSSSSELSQSTRASGPTNDDDFFQAKNQNGNGAKSRFGEPLIREFVDSVVAYEREVRNHSGLAHSLYESGNRDTDIQAWLDSGKKQPAKKIKGKAAIL